MSKLPEGVTSGYLAKQFISDQPADSLGVKSIQADATIEESLSHPPGSRANLRHVYILESSSTILRVSCDSQTPVYPPLYATDPDDPPVPKYLRARLGLVGSRNTSQKYSIEVL
jgi:hypothetical protein